MFNNLPRDLQERMKLNPSCVFPTITLPTAYDTASTLSLMQLVATSAYDQLEQAQAEFNALTQACAPAAPTTSAPPVPVHLAPASFPPVPTAVYVPAYVSQAESTLQCHQLSQQASRPTPDLQRYQPQHHHPFQPLPSLQLYEPPRRHSSQPAPVWPAPGWRMGEDPGPPPHGWQGCFNCFEINHMFRNCPHRLDADASNFFHTSRRIPMSVYINSTPESSLCRRPAAAPTAAPAAAVVPAAAAPVVVATPCMDSRPSRSAFTFIAQISILETSVDPPYTSNPMPLSFAPTLPHITIMPYPGVSVPVMFDTGSDVNLMSLSLLLWLQLVAPSAVIPIQVRGITTDAPADPSSIPGRLTKAAVLRTRHIITMGGVSSPLLLTFGIGSNVSVNACLGIATIHALCLLFNPVKYTFSNDDIGLLFKCLLRRPDPVLDLPPSPVIAPPSVLSLTLETHFIHQASGPILQIPHVIETNSAFGEACHCSYGLEHPCCVLPPLVDCSPTAE